MIAAAVKWFGQSGMLQLFLCFGNNCIKVVVKMKIPDKNVVRKVQSHPWTLLIFGIFFTLQH